MRDHPHYQGKTASPPQLVTEERPKGRTTNQEQFYSDGSNVRFTFGIPRGNDGSDGAPGEVSNAQLNSAISGTSNNTNGLSTLDSGFADPDMEALRQKMNEIIVNGRRWGTTGNSFSPGAEPCRLGRHRRDACAPY